MIQRFTDLRVWQEGHSLVLEIYTASKTFPKDELFGLTSQIRRAAVSVTSNIAEGFVRQTKNDKINFYTTSLASLSELRSQLLIARDLEYISRDSFTALEKKAETVSQMLTGLIRTAPNRIRT